MRSPVITKVRLSDEAWIVTSLLHREHPKRDDFTISEIVERAKREGVCGELRPGFRAHVTLHCVGNLPPNPGKTRMLYATGKHTRRLFLPGDDFHPDRMGSDAAPDRANLPSAYQNLLDWYKTFVASHTKQADEDPLMKLFGSGKDLWADEHPNDYVRRLREGWK